MDVNSNEWSVARIVNYGLNIFRTNHLLNVMIRFGFGLIQLWISTWAILWLSVFIYVIFYNLYMPSVFTNKDVFIQYDSTCDPKLIPNTCKIPYATVALTQGRTPEFLRGQTYRLSLDMKLPESDVNWHQGLFMVRLTLFDQNRRVALNVAKPTGLRYKSVALRWIALMFYWPLYVFGLSEESQLISVELSDNFVEGKVSGLGSTTEALVEIEARDIQIYPPTVLRISAALSGLRYYMYNWQPISFIVGTSTICFFIYVMTLIGFTKWYRNLQIENRIEDQLEDKDEDNNEDNNEVIDEVNNEVIEDINEQNIDEINDFLDFETNEINNEIEDEIQREVNEDLSDEQISQSDHCFQLEESGLTGDLSANESEASSTVVIPEAEDDNQLNDCQPDSSIG